MVLTWTNRRQPPGTLSSTRVTVNPNPQSCHMYDSRFKEIRCEPLFRITLKCYILPPKDYCRNPDPLRLPWSTSLIFSLPFRSRTFCILKKSSITRVKISVHRLCVNKFPLFINQTELKQNT